MAVCNEAATVDTLPYTTLIIPLPLKKNCTWKVRGQSVAKIKANNILDLISMYNKPVYKTMYEMKHSNDGPKLIRSIVTLLY